MNQRRKTLLGIAAALAVASVLPAAQAASQTPKERQAKIEKLKQNQRSFQQPRTMAEASATQVRLPDGTVVVTVPTELWNNLSASTDAQGKTRMHESDGSTATAATTEGLENE